MVVSCRSTEQDCAAHAWWYTRYELVCPRDTFTHTCVGLSWHWGPRDLSSLHLTVLYCTVLYCALSAGFAALFVWHMLAGVV